MVLVTVVAVAAVRSKTLLRTTSWIEVGGKENNGEI